MKIVKPMAALPDRDACVIIPRLGLFGLSGEISCETCGKTTRNDAECSCEDLRARKDAAKP